jgi:hypothetical protein
MDDVLADVAAGLDMINSENSALRVYHDGHYGNALQIHSFGLKGSAYF